MARQRKEGKSRGDNAGVNTVLHLDFSNDSVSDISLNPKIVCDSKEVDPLAKTYGVSLSGDKFYIADHAGAAWEQLPIVTLYKGLTYEFDTSNSSMINHKFELSEEIDGTHEGGDKYTAGWTNEGTPGEDGGKTTFTVPSSAPSKLYYYCGNHDGEGSEYGYVKIETAGQVGYSTGTYKSAGASAHFSGNAGIFISGGADIEDVYANAGDLTLEGDFTISFWAKSEATGYSEDQCLFDFGALTGFVESGTRFYIPMETGWSGHNVDLENILSVDFTEWNHFCLMRTDNFLSHYINGTGQGESIVFTGDLTPRTNSSSGSYHSIGCTRNYKNFYSGYMDDFFLHNVPVYGRDGFVPAVEDVSGKFASIAKDGLTAKHNATRLYLETDGGYRDFEMYDTDSVVGKLPSSGNIIPKESIDYSKQYIYPFSGQDVIISFYNQPNLINTKESVIKFYLDSGDGRKIMATDSGLGWVYTNEKDRYFDNNVKLLIQSTMRSSEELFDDYSNSRHAISGGALGNKDQGGIFHSTGLPSNGEPKFKNSSINFGGRVSQPSGFIPNDRLYVGEPQSSDWKWGSNEWTIDAWVQVPSSGNHAVMSKWASEDLSTGSGSWLVSVDSGVFSFMWKDTYGAGCTGESVTVSGTQIPDATGWNLLSIQRNKTRNQVEIFVNGAINGSGTIDAQAELCTSDGQNLLLGDFYQERTGFLTGTSHLLPFQGWMDSIRITKDVARYSENFVLPSGRFPDRFNNRLTMNSSNPKGTPIKPGPPNSLALTSNLRPRNWTHISTGDINLNASHLIINNIQPGYTGTWTAENWEDNRVFSTPRKVIVEDVIAGTGCVRPQITGFESRGQILSLADNKRNCSGCDDTEKPTWTGNCHKSCSIYDTHLYPHDHSTGVCGPYGWTHYRIFSGWLHEDSLPGFDAISGERYDGSTDNDNLVFVISEEPLGGRPPRRGGLDGCGPIANRTGSKYSNSLYREMSFSEVSGIPVTTFSRLNPYDGNLYETSGRLLVTGNGNMWGDNAINGAACMYMSVVDKTARDVFHASHGKEKITCLDECARDANSIMGTSLAASTHSLSDRGILDSGATCSGLCADYEEIGYSTFSECSSGCESHEETLPILPSYQYPPPGEFLAAQGESVRFSMPPPKRGDPIKWIMLTSGEFQEMQSSGTFNISNIQKVGTEMPSNFEWSFNKSEDDGMVAVPIARSATTNQFEMAGRRVMMLRAAARLHIVHPREDTTPTVHVHLPYGGSKVLWGTVKGHSPGFIYWVKDGDSNSSMTRRINNGSRKAKRVGARGVSLVIGKKFSAWIKPWDWAGDYRFYIYNGCLLDAAGDPIPGTCLNIQRSAIFRVYSTMKGQGTCCLNRMRRDFRTSEFDAGGRGRHCVIKSVKAFDIWKKWMGTHEAPFTPYTYNMSDDPDEKWTYADDYRNGRSIPAYRDYWHGRINTRWYWSTSIHGNPSTRTRGEEEDKYCYHPSTVYDLGGAYNNTKWNTKLHTTGCKDGEWMSFTGIGCPDRIAYEVTTIETITSQPCFMGCPRFARRHETRIWTAVEDSCPNFDCGGSDGIQLSQNVGAEVGCADEDGDGYPDCLRFSNPCGCRYLSLFFRFPSYDPDYYDMNGIKRRPHTDRGGAADGGGPFPGGGKENLLSAWCCEPGLGRWDPNVSPYNTENRKITCEFKAKVYRDTLDFGTIVEVGLSGKHGFSPIKHAQGNHLLLSNFVDTSLEGLGCHDWDTKIPNMSYRKNKQSVHHTSEVWEERGWPNEEESAPFEAMGQISYVWSGKTIVGQQGRLRLTAGGAENDWKANPLLGYANPGVYYRIPDGNKTTSTDGWGTPGNLPAGTYDRSNDGVVFSDNFNAWNVNILQRFGGRYAPVWGVQKYDMHFLDGTEGRITYTTTRWDDRSYKQNKTALELDYGHGIITKGRTDKDDCTWPDPKHFWLSPDWPAYFHLRENQTVGGANTTVSVGGRVANSGPAQGEGELPEVSSVLQRSKPLYTAYFLPFGRGKHGVGTDDGDADWQYANYFHNKHKNIWPHTIWSVGNYKINEKENQPTYNSMTFIDHNDNDNTQTEYLAGMQYQAGAQAGKLRWSITHGFNNHTQNWGGESAAGGVFCHQEGTENPIKIYNGYYAQHIEGRHMGGTKQYYNHILTPDGGCRDSHQNGLFMEHNGGAWNYRGETKTISGTWTTREWHCEADDRGAYAKASSNIDDHADWEDCVSSMEEVNIFDCGHKGTWIISNANIEPPGHGVLNPDPSVLRQLGINNGGRKAGDNIFIEDGSAHTIQADDSYDDGAILSDKTDLGAGGVPQGYHWLEPICGKCSPREVTANRITDAETLKSSDPVGYSRTAGSPSIGYLDLAFVVYPGDQLVVEHNIPSGWNSWCDGAMLAVQEPVLPGDTTSNQAGYRGAALTNGNGKGVARYTTYAEWNLTKGLWDSDPGDVLVVGDKTYKWRNHDGHVEFNPYETHIVPISMALAGNPRGALPPPGAGAFFLDTEV